MDPEHEMTDLSYHSSTARLISKNPTIPAPAQQPKASKIQDFLRHCRLQLLGFLLGRAFSWRSTFEQRKVASYQSRRMAALNSLFHLVPFCGAITLLFLYWTKLWVGGTSDNGTTLQFVAKLHELLMQASLVDVLLSIIRAQALNGYLPLGALSGATQAPQLSYLWSLDFISAVSSPTFSAWRKVKFALSASGLLFMTAVVGPSSAVLMIPRAGMPHVNNTITRYLNASEAALFPTHLDKTSGLNFSGFYDYRENEIIESSITPDYHIIHSFTWGNNELPDGTFSRVGKFVSRNDPQVEPTGVNYTIAKVPTILSYRQLSHHDRDYNMFNPGWSTTKMSWVMRTLQPVVLAMCTPEFRRAEDVYYLQDSGSKGSLIDATKLWNQLEVYDSANINTPYFYVPALWIPSPSSSYSLLGIFDNAFQDPYPSGKALRVTVCTLSSLWEETETSLTPRTPNPVVNVDLPTNKDAMLVSKSRPITIDPKDIISLNNPCMDKGLKDLRANSKDLALCFAATIAQIPGLDGHRRFNEASTISGYNLSELSDSTPFSLMKIDEVLTGFGYGSTDTSIKLSLAVIISYCVIVVFYVTYIIATGHTSIAWDSAMELVMLALQSHAPDHLGHISVGLDSMDTFRQNVGIRVRVDTEKNVDKLELVFQQDAGVDDGGLGMVEPNKAY